MTHLGKLPSGLSQDAWDTRRKDEMMAEQALSQDAALRGAPFLGQSSPLTPRIFGGNDALAHATRANELVKDLPFPPQFASAPPFNTSHFSGVHIAQYALEVRKSLLLCTVWRADAANNAGHARAVLTCRYLSGADIGFQYVLQEIRPAGTLPFYAEGEHTGLLLGSQLYMSWLVDEGESHRMLGQLVQFDKRPADGWWEAEFSNLPPEEEGSLFAQGRATCMSYFNADHGQRMRAVAFPQCDNRDPSVQGVWDVVLRMDYQYSDSVCLVVESVRRLSAADKLFFHPIVSVLSNEGNQKQWAI